MADIFVEHFANVCNPSHYPTRLQSIKDAEVLVSMDSGGLEGYNCTFSLHELHSALSSAEPTAPGKDDIIYDILKHLPTKAKDFLLNIFNRIWETGVLPKSWQISLIIPFRKPGKNAMDASSYRPAVFANFWRK